MESSGPSVHFLNVEYFFRLLYEALSGGGSVDFSWTALLALASQIWLLVTMLSVLVSLVLLGVFVNATIRYRRTLEEVEHAHATIHYDEAEETRDHSRWAHVRSLIESPNESDWRQAIIEADIMLDDLLSQLGYPGASVGEKLKHANPNAFRTLQYAWDAHRVRNEIAHAGSAYKLEEHAAHRTIAMYEAVMREHGEI